LPFEPTYGLGYLWHYIWGVGKPVIESDVVSPGEMISILDSRVQGRPWNPWGNIGFMVFNHAAWEGEVAKFRHGQNFNVLFSDTHVSAMPHRLLLNPSKTWQNWNRDRQMH
jgi:prepilin-type processing-associated H-X9-DG protein